MKRGPFTEYGYLNPHYDPLDPHYPICARIDRDRREGIGVIYLHDALRSASSSKPSPLTRLGRNIDEITTEITLTARSLVDIEDATLMSEIEEIAITPPTRSSKVNALREEIEKSRSSEDSDDSQNSINLSTLKQNFMEDSDI